MRIGVITPIYSRHKGGSSTFQQAIFDAIRNSISLHHEYILLDQEGNPISETIADLPVQPNGITHRSTSDGHSGNIVHKVFGKIYSLLRRTKNYLWLKASKPDGDQVAPLDRVKAYNLDFVWYLTPFYMDLPYPFAFTVWDLQHRRQPYFPEVSVIGWTWDKREQLYQSRLLKATCVVVGTEVGKQEVLNYYNIEPDNILINPLPCTSAAQRFASLDRSGAFELLSQVHFGKPIDLDRFFFYPAQFWAHKNHVNLLLALKQLNRMSNLNYHLVLTGSDQGNLSYINEIVSHHGLIEVTHFLGFVDEMLLASLYKCAIALVFPSFFGPDNLPPLEAFSYGCPVLASNVPGASEQLGDAAILFDPKDPTSIADAMQIVASRETVRHRLVERGLSKLVGRSPIDYLNRMDLFFDSFEAVRRSWPNSFGGL